MFWTILNNVAFLVVYLTITHGELLHFSLKSLAWRCLAFKLFLSDYSVYCVGNHSISLRIIVSSTAKLLCGEMSSWDIWQGIIEKELTVFYLLVKGHQLILGDTNSKLLTSIKQQYPPYLLQYTSNSSLRSFS